MKVDRYRTGVASLLSKLVVAVGEIERWLDFAVDGDEASARAVLECTGQVVLIFHNLMIVPERGESVVNCKTPANRHFSRDQKRPQCLRANIGSASDSYRGLTRSQSQDHPPYFSANLLPFYTLQPDVPVLVCGRLGPRRQSQRAGQSA